jgi:alkylhydroperoxidase family enzyme
VVELTLAVAYFSMIARFLETTGVEVEPAVDGGVLHRLR